MCLRVLRAYGVQSMTNGGRYLGTSSTRLRQQVWYSLVVGKTKTKTKKYRKAKTKLKLKNNWKTKTKTKTKSKSKRKSHCMSAHNCRTKNFSKARIYVKAAVIFQLSGTETENWPSQRTIRLHGMHRDWWRVGRKCSNILVMLSRQCTHTVAMKCSGV